ncbi:MAG: M24 family metallopeptidase [Desulfovibrionaceae bacterium]
MIDSIRQAARYAARRDRVRAALQIQGIDALLVTHAANRYYLSGFELHDPQCNESAGALLITAGGDDRLLTDPRYLDAARRLWPEEGIFIYRGSRNEKLREYFLDTVRGVIGFEPSAVCFDTYTALTAAVDGKALTLKPVRGVVEGLRVCKDADEIAAMERSIALNHHVFAQVPGLLEPGKTEKQLAWEIEKLFRENGASELAFESIVAVGPNGALPHAIPGEDRVLDNCPVLVDVGGRLDDYCSDQTRTFWVGPKPADAFSRALEQVQEAQARAIAVIRPGLPMADAYAVARGYFEKYGVEAYFTHGLGHGLGLETHEAPSLSPMGKGELAPGMVVTVEPGLYYPEWGGIRWEYDILVTEDGCRVL